MQITQFVGKKNAVNYIYGRLYRSSLSGKEVKVALGQLKTSKFSRKNLENVYMHTSLIIHNLLWYQDIYFLKTEVRWNKRHTMKKNNPVIWLGLKKNMHVVRHRHNKERFGLSIRQVYINNHKSILTLSGQWFLHHIIGK